MLYKEFEKNREDILENEFCMQSECIKWAMLMHQIACKIHSLIYLLYSFQIPYITFIPTNYSAKIGFLKH